MKHPKNMRERSLSFKNHPKCYKTGEGWAFDKRENRRAIRRASKVIVISIPKSCYYKKLFDLR